MILLVEDEPMLRDVVARILRMEQYTVLEAENGEHALALLKTHPVNLIITDFALPDVDGLTLVSRFVERQPGIPVIMMSGYFSEPAGADMVGKVAEVSKYLTKPFGRSE